MWRRLRVRSRARVEKGAPPVPPPPVVGGDAGHRRLSLDGELPARPDEGAEAGGEGVRGGGGVSGIEVGGCSKAGWEPVRAPGDTVAVEVRKENQDAYCTFVPFGGEASGSARQVFLGVFDGHGAEGRNIAHFARDWVTRITRETTRSIDVGASGSGEVPRGLHRARLDTLKSAFSRAERGLTEPDSGIDHVFSGTTAVVSWFFDRDVYTAWAGDSRSIVGRATASDDGRVRYRAIELSHDQKPVRPDEKKRVKSAGGRVARWRRNIGPLRVWLPHQYVPGLAMTRSIGDTVLSEYGVSPVPEVTYTRLGATDEFMVLASDGVWEFMTSQDVADFIGRMRREGKSAAHASEALVREAVRRWRRNEVVVDDTTAVVMWMSWDAVSPEADASDPVKTPAAVDEDVQRPKKVFSMGRTKVVKPKDSHQVRSGTVYLIDDDGRLTDFVCKNDLLSG